MLSCIANNQTTKRMKIITMNNLFLTFQLMAIMPKNAVKAAVSRTYNVLCNF